jgi:hypothetical protein
MIQEAARYWLYIHTMKLWSCHEKTYAALFQFIFAAPHYRASTRKNVVETIETGTCKERCVVLELAVWKFLCTMQCPNNLRGILDVSEWCQRGWKIPKTQARRSNAFHIFITSVLPFMDLYGALVPKSTLLRNHCSHEPYDTPKESKNGSTEEMTM